MHKLESILENKTDKILYDFLLKQEQQLQCIQHVKHLAFLNTSYGDFTMQVIWKIYLKMST